jgi:hypothetical protein
MKNIDLKVSLENCGMLDRNMLKLVIVDIQYTLGANLVHYHY